MSIPRFFSRQTVLVNMLMIAILVAGLFSLHRMPMENAPAVDFDSVIIIVPYPGASPEDVEKLITLPIEDEITSLPDIDFIQSASSEGRCVFFIQYEVGLDNFDQAVMDLKSEVDKVKPELPQEAQDNMFTLKLASEDVWPIMAIALGGEYSNEGLKRISDSLKEELLDIPDVASIDISGILNREIWVEADRDRLETAGVSLTELTAAIQMANINLPSGRVEMGREEFLVRSMGEIDEPEQVGRVIVRIGRGGESARVADLARVTDTFERDEIIGRLNGKSSVYIRVFMKREGSVVDVAEQVREVVDQYREKVPGVDLSIRNDQSKDVVESISVLTTNALTGLVLVSILMTLIIGMRSAILAVIGIPFAFLSAFIFLDATGGTINTLSLFAFILVLGMVVDDAIIIIENVYRHMEEGKTPVQAAVAGTEQVMWPVIAAVLTTIAAFLPLLMMEGIVGKFLQVLPIVVTLALIGSLIQSLVVLPSHLNDFGRLPKKKGDRFGDRFYDKLLRLYRWQINKFLDHRYLVTFGTFVATVVFTALAANILRIEMFPEEATSTERLIMRLPTGTKLEETDRVMQDIESRVADMVGQELNSYQVLTGLVIENQQWTRTTEGGMVIFELADEDSRPSNSEVKNRIRKRIRNIPELKEAYFTRGEGGPPVGEPVEIRVRGDNLERLRELADMVMEEMKSVAGITDVKMDHRPGKREVQFIPDRVKMAAYGVSMTDLSLTMRSAVEGYEATKFRDEMGDEVKVRVLYREADRNDLDDLKRITISTSLGIHVPLAELGEFKVERGASQIHRRDGKRAITVTADVDKVTINSDEANRVMREKYDDFSTRFPGFNLDFGGEFEEQQKSFASLIQAFIVALVLIYLILGTQFQSFSQPLVVMFTVPFSILGVAIGLILMNLTFSLVAGISVVALSGVVVNDSLVLVDFINKGRASGLSRRRALVESGSRRMRPILLTTVTTIAGLTPMAFGLGGSTETWQPLAICFCWGLAFATFLTLFVIPCSYAILDDIVNIPRRWVGMETTGEALIRRAAELHDDTIHEDIEAAKEEENRP